MPKKTIEVSERVFEKLSKHKGNNTWDEHLGKMADATYDDIAYLNPTSISDFAEDTDQYSWRVTASNQGRIQLTIQSEEADSMITSELSNLSPSEGVVVQLVEGSPSTE
ncbi:hypothetical protein [Halorubrum vacuolatum]|uniref:Uncharacterized protein n=1 Tax=Halorubrum vacuolatum TaxID=63740 RepID=A0A238W9A7_HALVU|nr:hypothetical protein [Halorubrum vacuolatum]SNR42874.1 hypothetical protein SAMN06264855_10640 [Halorubrum vacuolatum]